MMAPLLFLTALLVALPLTAAQRERPKSADLSEPVVASPYRWEKMSEVDGLTVYWSRVAGSGVVAYRMEGILGAPLEKAASFLLDPKRTPGWIEGLADSRTAPGPLGGTVHWTLFKARRWSAPRDHLVQVQAAYDPRKRTFSIAGRPTEDPRFPPAPGVVRGDLTFLAQLIPMTFPDQTFLRLEFHCLMKGKLPDWRVDLIEQAWPGKIFQALKERTTGKDLVVLPEVKKLLATQPPAVPLPRTRRAKRIR